MVSKGTYFYFFCTILEVTSFIILAFGKFLLKYPNTVNIM